MFDLWFILIFDQTQLIFQFTSNFKRTYLFKWLDISTMKWLWWIWIRMIWHVSKSFLINISSSPGLYLIWFLSHCDCCSDIDTSFCIMLRVLGLLSFDCWYLILRWELSQIMTQWSQFLILRLIWQIYNVLGHLIFKNALLWRFFNNEIWCSLRLLLTFF